jgi:hypothetical protein
MVARTRRAMTVDDFGPVREESDTGVTFVD